MDEQTVRFFFSRKISNRFFEYHPLEIENLVDTDITFNLVELRLTNVNG